MSGGYFDYQMFDLNDISDLITKAIKKGYKYSPEVVDKLQQTVRALEIVGNMIHHTDWLLSNDYCEESFLKHWNEDMLTHSFKQAIDHPREVIIEVRGGVAEVVECPQDVDVEIKDYD